MLQALPPHTPPQHSGFSQLGDGHQAQLSRPVSVASLMAAVLFPGVVSAWQSVFILVNELRIGWCRQALFGVDAGNDLVWESF